jgi:hypothetical protein
VVTKKGDPKEGVLDRCASYSQSVEDSWSAINHFDKSFDVEDIFAPPQ